MMYGQFTLDNFYTSKAWIKFYTLLRLQRTDENGQLICWHCHKPITQKYDAIAHHTIFLTEQNVNDASISLNPDLVQFVHHRCHNRIHNKLGYRRQEVYLVYGSPLSGKSTWVDQVSDYGDLIVDLDLIWASICGGEKYIKPQCLNSVAFGIRDYLLDTVKIRRGKWDNAYVIGGYPLISERERICRMLGAREIYIESTKEECLLRLQSDTDRDFDEWKKYIESWWERYIPPHLAEN